MIAMTWQIQWYAMIGYVMFNVCVLKEAMAIMGMSDDEVSGAYYTVLYVCVWVCVRACVLCCVMWCVYT